VHRPGYEFKIITDPQKWGFAGKPHLETSQKEHDLLTDILKGEGVNVHYIGTEEATSANLFMTNDLGVCTSKGIILANFKSRHRRGEELYLQLFAMEKDIPVVGQIKNEAFEAGDLVTLSEKLILCGLGRTTMEGIKQLTHYLDVAVMPVDISKEYKHLNKVFAMVDRQLAVIYKKAFNASFFDFLRRKNIELVPIYEEEQALMAANVLTLEAGKVVMVDAAPRVRRELEKRGVDVITTDMRELSKGDCGPRSLVLTLYRS